MLIGFSNGVSRIAAQTLSGYRYWRIVITSADTAQFYSIDEIEMFDVPSGGTDLTTGRGANASASSTNSGQLPSYAVDNTANTEWWSSTTGTQWWQMDFGASVKKNIVLLTLRSALYNPERTPRVFSLQGSNDGSTFSLVKDFTTPAWTAGVTRNFAV